MCAIVQAISVCVHIPLHNCCVHCLDLCAREKKTGSKFDLLFEVTFNTYQGFKMPIT